MWLIILLVAGWTLFAVAAVVALGCCRAYRNIDKQFDEFQRLYRDNILGTRRVKTKLTAANHEYSLKCIQLRKGLGKMLDMLLENEDRDEDNVLSTEQ